MDKKDLVYIGKLANGAEVYDRPDSHWQTAHKVVTEELLKEALGKIDTDEELYLGTIDMGRKIGKTYCVPTTSLDQIFMARRYGRLGETPTILNKPPIDCSTLAVVLNKSDEFYTLSTTYIGEIAPMEPWDPELIKQDNPDEMKKSQEFWNTHALVYDRSAIDYLVIDGEQVSKEEFESRYIKNRHAFDVPSDSLLLMIGVSASGKTTKANAIARNLGGEVFSSDEIRKELFAKEISQDKKDIVYSNEAKKEVYDVMIERVQANLEQGKFTIADATFLFENGENARRELYRLAQQYKRPIRAVIMNIPYEYALNQNLQRANPVDESVIKDMYDYMSKNYTKIEEELKTMPNTKITVVGGNKIPNQDAPRR